MLTNAFLKLTIAQKTTRQYVQILLEVTRVFAEMVTLGMEEFAQVCVRIVGAYLYYLIDYPSVYFRNHRVTRYKISVVHTMIALVQSKRSP